MGPFATTNRKIPLKQLDGMRMSNGTGRNPELQWKAGSARLQQEGTSAPSDSSWWGALCLRTWNLSLILSALRHIQCEAGMVAHSHLRKPLGDSSIFLYMSVGVCEETDLPPNGCVYTRCGEICVDRNPHMLHTAKSLHSDLFY